MFFIVEKILIFWFGQEIGKTTGFGGLGEPPTCSLTTESVQFRQQSGRFKMQVTTERVWSGKKKARAFARAICQNVAMMKISNRRKARVRGHDNRSWVSTERFQTPAHYPLHVISKSAPSGDSQLRSHGASFLPSDRYIHD